MNALNSIRLQSYHIGCKVWNCLPNILTADLAKICRKIRIIAIEAFANIRYVIPNAVQWYYLKLIKREITSYPLQITVGKVKATATLYLHGKLKVSNREVIPALITHGDYGHPFTTLHLAKIAQKTSHPVFSLYISKMHDELRWQINSDLMHAAINKIEELVVKENGIFKGLAGAGHSRGGMLLAERQFVYLDPRIKGVFGVGCKLNSNEADESSSEIERAIFKKIYEAIKADIKDRPIYQIIPEEDWSGPRELMAVRPDRHCYSVPGMHLSGLYDKKTVGYFEKFLSHVLVFTG